MTTASTEPVTRNASSHNSDTWRATSLPESKGWYSKYPQGEEFRSDLALLLWPFVLICSGRVLGGQGTTNTLRWNVFFTSPPALGIKYHCGWTSSVSQ